MNFGNLINQVLKGAQSYNQSRKPQTSSSTGGLGDIINALGGSTAAVSLLSMLLKRRKGVGGLGKTGSLAALGAVAYYAYQQWQKSQSNTDPKGVLDAEAFAHNGQDAEQVGNLILRTMIAAAAADGEIDEQERQAIIKEAGDDNEAAQWLAQQTQNPVSPENIAREVGSNTALAAEVYLAARLICGELNRKEIVFLAQLAQALKLDPQLVAQLDKQASVE